MEMRIKRILGNFLQHEQNMPKSIWGRHWTRDRKWFLPAWLIYEASSRFYGYAHAVHNFFEKHQDAIAPYIGKIGAQTLGVLCGTALFLFNSALLTIPACFAIYIFYKKGSLTGTKLEEKIKRVG